MFKEVLQIQPKIESNDLNKMEDSLGKRFQNVAKKFGKGLVGSLAGGGFLAAATAVLDKLFNPLKEVQEAIDKSLHSADSLKDQATSFNTSPGELAKLQAFGKAKGLEASEVNELLRKFQIAVAEATADTSKDTSVRKFVGNKDTAQAFLTYLENLSNLAKKNPVEAVRAQQEVFGERQIGKTGTFLQADFGELSKRFSSISTDRLTSSINKQASLEEIKSIGEAFRELKDINSKAQIINAKIINSMETQKDIALQRENAKIARAEDLAALKTLADGITATIDTKLIPLIGQGVKAFEQLPAVISALDKISSSPLLRRFGLFGKKKE